MSSDISIPPSAENVQITVGKQNNDKLFTIWITVDGRQVIRLLDVPQVNVLID